MDNQPTQEQIDEFVVAAHHDLPRVQALLLETPALLNEAATWFETAMGAAAHTGSLAIGTFLLEQGADMDICAAAAFNRTADVEALLAEESTLIDAVGAHNLSLLYHAAISGSLPLVQMLVNRGANVNAGMPVVELDADDPTAPSPVSTALHGAAGFGHIEIVRYLIEQGADFTAVDPQGRSPLDVAAATHHDEIAAMLRSYMDIEAEE